MVTTGWYCFHNERTGILKISELAVIKNLCECSYKQDDSLYPSNI